ncbi:hypothetical protein [Acidisoma silvae]|uniref:Uncharacterized protein n=1 Tax=Acidisoma silvae TaxID=2802396 RepID=A0A964E1P6_9PROT|nr:hypothetical protein [Acidisoma silvae]MCB8878444.1 hypothetical protein [Acidisoma silvae]
MSVTSSAAVRTAKANVDLSAIGSDAVLTIYDGTRPATPDTAISGNNPLVVFTMTGAFGTVSDGVLTAATIPAASVTTAGTAAWARLATSGGTAVYDFAVSTETAATGDIQFAAVDMVAGVQVSIASFTLTEQ